MRHTRLLPVLAALLLALAGASEAQAGQYPLAYDFSSDLSGWSGYVEPGYLLCGHGATAGCADVTTNRILARAGSPQAIWSQGRWEWTAPPGTTIVGGALAYRTRMLHTQFFARVKMRADGVDWDAAPTLVSEQRTTALTDHVLPLAGGFRQLGIALYAHPALAGVVTGVWDDYVTLVRLDVTVDDSVAPALAWVDGGGLLDGVWHRGDVCATLAIADGQSGVGSVTIASDGAAATWSAPRTGSQYQPGYAGGDPNLCLAAAALGDGLHAGFAGGTDVSGGAAASLPFTVGIDMTPPTTRLVSPAATVADGRPAIELLVGDATSGVASVAAQLDGAAQPLDVTGGRAVGRPAVALAPGAHTLSWSVVDAAGNRTDASARFTVPDPPPPPPAAPGAPAAGSGAGGGAPAGGGSVPAGGAAVAAPSAKASPGRQRAVAIVRALMARIGHTRPRVVVVRLRARAHTRFVLRLRCGTLTRTLHLRAGTQGIATTRVDCPGVATLRLTGGGKRLVVHIAARRLPLRLQVQPQSRSAPTVARVSGRLPELRRHFVLLEALTLAGWRPVGRTRADARGHFSTSFAILHAGQFALRARAPELAGIASAPFVLTMR